MSSDRVDMLKTLGVGPALLKQFVSEYLADVRNDTMTAATMTRLLNEIEADVEKQESKQYSALLSTPVTGSAEPAQELLTLIGINSKLADSSVKVLDAAYNRVDGAVASLDKKLKLLDAVLRAQGAAVDSEALKPSTDHVPPPEAIAGRTRHGRGSLTAGPAGAGRPRPDYSNSGAGRSSAASSSASGSGSLRKSYDSHGAALDMEVDDHEPTYCTCGQVAFGEMIGCDNDACPIEWFHCQCVGVTPATRPPGKWFCPTCR